MTADEIVRARGLIGFIPERGNYRETNLDWTLFQGKDLECSFVRCLHWQFASRLSFFVILRWSFFFFAVMHWDIINVENSSYTGWFRKSWRQSWNENERQYEIGSIKLKAIEAKIFRCPTLILMVFEYSIDNTIRITYFVIFQLVLNVRNKMPKQSSFKKILFNSVI